MRAKLRKDGNIVAEGTIPDNPNHSDGRFTADWGDVSTTEYTLVLEDGTEREIMVTRTIAGTAHDTVASYTNAFRD